MSYNIILSMSQQSPPLRRLISQIVYVKNLDQNENENNQTFF